MGRIRAGTAGLNYRNLELLQPLNPAAWCRVADHKRRTKEALARAGIPVVPTLASARSRRDLPRLSEEIDRRCSFVLKPAVGSGGEGVLLVTGREGGRFLGAGGKSFSASDLRVRALDILGGAFSAHGIPGEALLEPLLRNPPALAAFSPGGLADVRVLLYRGFPVLAMLRLPTSRSRGRANLHAGGVAVALDLPSGRTRGGWSLGRPTDRHPDTGVALSGYLLPKWSELLELATRSHDALPLGFAAVDLVLDEEERAVVLEVNARPGLSVQLATRQGLVELLRRFAPLVREGLSWRERLETSLSFLS